MLIDEKTFEVLKSTIKKTGWLELPSYGNSMFPYIRQGNFCRFVTCEPTSLKKGDVVLYYCETGQLIAHRLVEVKEDVFIFKGDTNLGLDQPVSREWILGKLDTVRKRHTSIAPNHFLPVLWGKLILSFPILSGILRKYLNRKLQF